jgi:hypothetical protein
MLARRLHETDPEKGKYFKIASGAGAAGAKYTPDKVKKETKKGKAKQKAAGRLEQRRKQTVFAHHAEDHLLRAYMQRELGSRPSLYCMRNIWPGACVSGYEAQLLLKKRCDVIYFDVNLPANRIYYAANGARVRRDYLPRSRYFVSTVSDFSSTAESLIYMTSPVSSLNCVPVSGAMVLTTSGSDRAPVIHLSDPEVDGPHIGEQFAPHDISTIWTAAPKPTFSVSEGNSIPTADTECVAVGTSHGVSILTRSPGDSWSYNDTLKCDTDVRALAWLSPTSLVLGQRDGRILLYDTRSKGSAHILSHSAPINHIRPADDFTRIVVSGICNTLTMYDMRHSPTPPPPWKREGRGRHHKRQKTYGSSSHALTSGQPFHGSNVLTTFAYNNEDTQHLGMDVHVRLGLVAAGDEDGKLNVYNMYTGEFLRALSPTGPIAPTSESSKLWPEVGIRCLRFVDDENDGVSLWATVNGGVTQYTWSPMLPS